MLNSPSFYALKVSKHENALVKKHYADVKNPIPGAENLFSDIY